MMYYDVQALWSHKTRVWPVKGYDGPAETQFAVDLAAMGALALLLQLLGTGIASWVWLPLGNALKVYAVHLDGHPAEEREWGERLKVVNTRFLIDVKTSTLKVDHRVKEAIDDI